MRGREVVETEVSTSEEVDCDTWEDQGWGGVGGTRQLPVQTLGKRGADPEALDQGGRPAY